MRFPKDLSPSAGVYVFRDRNKKAIYVGKAKNLKNRVSSYFHNRANLGPKTRRMLDEANDLKTIVTETELEALLLEADLINRLKPRYNTKWVDDKHFKYIVIDFPRVHTARTKSNPKAIYFGPYPEGKTVNQILKLLRKIFPFRDCSQTKFCHYQKLGRGCLYHHLQLCPAPCIGAVSTAEYQKTIDELTQLLKGKKKDLQLAWEREMNRASQNKEYEKAKLFRDRIIKLNYITQKFSLPEDFLKDPNLPVDIHQREIQQLWQILNLKNHPPKRFRLEAYDISNLQGRQATGSMAVFVNGSASKSDYRRFKIKTIDQADDVAMLQEVLRRRFTSSSNKFATRPDQILIDGGVPQLNVALKIMKELKLEIPAVALAKKEEIVYFRINGKTSALKLSQNSPALHLLQRARDEAHRFALQYHRKLRACAKSRRR